MRTVWAFIWLSIFSSAWASPCLLWEDSQRITHAKAEDEASSVYCLGYLHGRDRAWQMDHFRRTVEGTNAEVHGFSYLKGDLMMRLLDLSSWAQKLWAGLGDEEKLWLQQYSKGVNHGFSVAKKNPTQEFKNGHPEPRAWEPVDSLGVLLLQSFDQTRKTFGVEWDESKATEKWGEYTSVLYNPDDVPWDVTTLKAGEYPAVKKLLKKVSVHKPLPPLWSPFPTPFGEESGSNNWAVAPSRTKNGAAIFANDPHLDMRTPLFWYWVHLESPASDVIGASLPGVPLIVSGTNRNISWGLTNAYIDTADAVRIPESESDKLVTVRPLVWIKFSFIKLPFFFKWFKKTEHGYPVLPLDNPHPEPLVLKWSGFHLQGTDLRAMRDLMKVDSAENMDKTLAQVGVPAWNFVYADVKGKIGYRVIGKTFRLSESPLWGFRDGDLDRIHKPDFLSPSEMPHILNPKRGWVATANNRHWPADSALHGGRAYSQGFRAQRIDELIQANTRHDVESFSAIQCDNRAADAPYFVPLFLKGLETVATSAEQKAWLTKLAAWDFSTMQDCEVCAIYRRTLDGVMDELKITEFGFWRLGNEGHAEWMSAMSAEFIKAWKVLQGKRWGEVHFNSFSHLSNRKDWVFSPEIATRGDKHSVNPGTMRWDEDLSRFFHTSGASERLIVEMKDTPEVWLTLPGLNARYDDHQGANPWKAWESCERSRVEWPVNWAAKSLEKVEVAL